MDRLDRRFSGPGGSWAGGPSERQKNYASNLHEEDALIRAYEHLTGLPDPPEALHRLRKIASLVKPIMRKRGWHVGTLTEFLPEDPRLLGLNINHGHKICVRLRFSHRPSSFLPIEQCVDTMLHELSHIVFGPHDAKFHALWDELRAEHETLLLKGYTGEGFLTKGHKLGGGRMPPNSELRRMAKQNAEKQRKSDKEKGKKTGFKLGGKSIPLGQDPRKVIADAVERRNTIDRGCASGAPNADSLARQSSQKTIKTKSSEDDANDRAIAEALLELMEEEEMMKLEQSWDGPSYSGGLEWNPQTGLSAAPASRGRTPPTDMSEQEQIKWALKESMRTSPSSKADTRRSESPMPAPAARSIPRSGSAPIPSHIREKTNKSGKRPRPFTPDADINMSGGLGPPSVVSVPTSSFSANKKPAPRGSTSRSSSASSVLSDLAGALTAADAPTWRNGAERIRRKPTPPSSNPSPHARSRSPPPPLPENRPNIPQEAPPRPPQPADGPAAKAPPQPPRRLPSPPRSEPAAPSWTCDICTCINPLQYLACDACGLERSPSATAILARSQQQNAPNHRHSVHSGTTSSSSDARSGVLSDRSAARNLERIQRQSAILREPENLGWACRRCRTFMEHRYWTCSVCGLMKGDSRANEHVVR
ncbi:WLM domain-containing protein 3 [Elsinoe australis]|uniref:WLM domain-containing protein 3 n=1 Tax=Elsinoe australis TaxID=40998 RepID=A0A4V6DT37_9PEZI|nr:WLM domain-containing protein 3 [Elsinoe australis]